MPCTCCKVLWFPVLRFGDSFLEGVDKLLDIAPLSIYNSDPHMSDAEILIYKPGL